MAIALSESSGWRLEFFQAFVDFVFMNKIESSECFGILPLFYVDFPWGKVAIIFT